MTKLTTHHRLLTFMLGLAAVLLVGRGTVHAQTNGYEYAVDVQNGYVKASNAQLPTTNFTVEVWVKPEFVSYGNRKIIGNTNQDGNPSSGYNIGKESDGSLAFEVWDENGNYLPMSGGSLAAGEWAHIALTYDQGSSTLTAYLDGQQVAQRTDVPSVSNPGTPLIVGVAPWDETSFYYDGVFDEVRVWNTTRTQSEVQNAMDTPLEGNESGLVHYYPLEAGSGSTASDQAGSADGTFEGDASWVSPGAPLPVEVASFDAVPSDGVVTLAWQTLSETNNAHFRLERSGAGDGAWTTVGTRTSKAPGGTTTESLRYTFEDADLPFEAQTLTYRLVQQDLDGKESVVAEQLVEIGASESVALHGAVPNPVRNQATLRYEVPSQRHVTVTVHDVLGRTVRTLVDAQQSGRQVVQLDAQGLSSGVYFYRVSAGAASKTSRLVVH